MIAQDEDYEITSRWSKTDPPRFIDLPEHWYLIEYDLIIAGKHSLNRIIERLGGPEYTVKEN